EASCATCADSCYSTGVGCMATCETLFRRRLGLPAPATFDPSALMACEACGAAVAGLCLAGDVDCSAVAFRGGYPAPCARGCIEGFPDDRTGRYACLNTCIQRIQSSDACDFDPSAVDPNANVPCCYSEVCAGEMDAVLKMSEVECFQNSVCGSGRRCNDRGLCENRLREEQTSCSVSSTAAPTATPFWFMVLLSIGLWFLGRARRGAAAVSVGLLVILGLLWPEPVSAEPRGFRRTRASLVAGLSVGGFAGGNAGEVIRDGIGVSVQETIQSGFIGGTVRLGTTIFSTKQAALPFDTGVQAYYLAVGPRFVFPTLDSFDLYIYLEPEYQFTTLNSNTALS